MAKDLLRFSNQTWTKGPYYNEDVENIRKEMLKKGVGLKELAEHMSFTRQHMSCCLKGKYKLTKRNQQFILKYLEGKSEHCEVVL